MGTPLYIDESHPNQSKAAANLPIKDPTTTVYSAAKFPAARILAERIPVTENLTPRNPVKGNPAVEMPATRKATGRNPTVWTPRLSIVVARDRLTRRRNPGMSIPAMVKPATKNLRARSWQYGWHWQHQLGHHPTEKALVLARSVGGPYRIKGEPKHTTVCARLSHSPARGLHAPWTHILAVFADDQA